MASVPSLVFMGTPELAIPTLQALIQSPYKIQAVYTQPPRPLGRGQNPQPSPIHRFAQAHGLKVVTPVSLKSFETQQELNSFQADIIVVMAYGLLLPSAVLEMPTYGCINVHVSLLPRWRGASPIQQAILAGDTHTGVTLMQMDQGLDTGPILTQQSIPIHSEMTSATLADQLATLGAQMIVPGLEGHLNGSLIAHPQPLEGITHAPKIQKEAGNLDWRRSAVQLERQIRAFTPWPGSSFVYRDEQIKVLQATYVSSPHDSTPGQVLDSDLLIGCGQGALRLLKVQRPGKAPLAAADFLRGCPIAVGTQLKLPS